MRDFWTSISAFTEAKGKDGRGGCLRRWAFKKLFKLPVPSKEATSFGDVMHAVLARYYSADDRGLVDGKPVNLYPDGWKVVPDRFGRESDDAFTKAELSIIEESLIKSLMTKALSEGILVRTPGRQIEQPFPNTILYKHPTLLTAMVLKGFMDLETPRSVEDHKTVKSLKYAVSLKGLQTDAQMLMYAKIKYNKGHTGPLWLIHNNFIKDTLSPDVIRREIIVEQEYVEDYYQRVLLPGFMQMFDVYLKYDPKKDLNRWSSISGPADPDSECNHYYGAPCPFSSICSGMVDACTYIAKFKDLNQQNREQIAQAKSSNIPLSKENTNPIERNFNMDLINRIKAGNAAATTPPPTQPATPPAAAAQPAGGIAGVLAGLKAKAAQATPPSQPTPPPPPPAAPAPVAQPAPATPTTPAHTPAPWYQPGCVACTQNDYPGFNSQGNPCQVCENIAELAGKPTSKMFDYACDAEGNIQFTPKPGTVVPPVTGPASAPVTPPPAPAPEKPKRTRKSTQVNTVPPAIPGQAATPAVQETPAASLTALPEAETPADGPAGFDLLIGVTYAKGFTPRLVSADDILREALAYLSSVGGIDVATLDHFAVKAALDAYIPTVAMELVKAGSVVISVAPTKGTYLALMLDGLRPYAKTVLVGMA